MVRNYKRKTVDRWTKEALLEALTNIKEGKIKINEAATHYRISRATLYRQYKKFLQAGGKLDVNQFRACGGNSILRKVEEDVLEKTILDLREGNYTVGSTDIKRICFEYCDTNGISNKFNQEKRLASDDWYYGFLNRHPKVRTGDGIIISEFVPKRKTKKKKAKSDEMELVEVKTGTTSPTQGEGNNDVVASGSGSSSEAAAPKLKANAKFDEVDLMEVKTDEAKSLTCDGGGGDNGVVGSGIGNSAGVDAPKPEIQKKLAKSDEMEVMEVKTQTDEPKSVTHEGGGGDNDVVASGSGSSAATATAVSAVLADKGAKASPKRSAPKRKATGSQKRASRKKKVKMEETIIVNKGDEEILEQLKNDEELENDLKLGRENAETDDRG